MKGHGLERALGALHACPARDARPVAQEVFEPQSGCQHSSQTVARFNEQAPAAWMILLIQGHGPRGKGTLLPREFAQ